MSANRMAGTMPGAVGAAVDMLRWPSTAAMANPRDHTTETVAQIPAPWFASREQQQQGQQQQQVIAQQQQVIALQQQQQQQQLQHQEQIYAQQAAVAAQQQAPAYAALGLQGGTQSMFHAPGTWPTVFTDRSHNYAQPAHIGQMRSGAQLQGVCQGAPANLGPLDHHHHRDIQSAYDTLHLRNPSLAVDEFPVYARTFTRNPSTGSTAGEMVASTPADLFGMPFASSRNPSAPLPGHLPPRPPATSASTIPSEYEYVQGELMQGRLYRS